MLPATEGAAPELHVGDVQRILKISLAGCIFVLLQVDWYAAVQRDERFARLHRVARRVRGDRYRAHGAFIDASRVDYQAFFSRDLTPGHTQYDHVHLLRTSAYVIPPHLLPAPPAAVAALGAAAVGGGGQAEGDGAGGGA